MEIESLIAPDQEVPLPASIEPDVLSSIDPSIENTRKGPERFDFRQSAFLPAAEMRNLRKHHGHFIEALTGSLANYLRTEVLLSEVKLRTVTYRDFAASVRAPTHLTLLKVEPLRGVCIVDVPPGLALTMVDRLLGGSGAVVESRELSEIETVLMDQVVHLLVSEWCNTWEKGSEIRPLALAHEISGQFLQSSTPDTTMFVLEIGVRMGECAEQVQVLFPWHTIESLFEELAPKLVSKSPAQLRVTQPSKWRSEFAEIPMDVTVHGPVVQLPARDLARLRIGDMIDLDPQFVNHLNVHIGKVAKFSGRLGTSGTKWAVEITGVQTIL
jgi:flagellar motor switch protein FliM